MTAYAALLGMAAADDQTYYHTCSTQVSSGGRTTVYISDPFVHPYDTDNQLSKAYKRYLQSQGIDAPYANCSWTTTPERAARSVDRATAFAERSGGIVSMVRWLPDGAARAQLTERATETKAPQKPDAADTLKSSSSAGADPDAPSAPVRTAEEREAEWQAKVARYEAAKAEWAATIEAQRQEEARRQAEHRAAQDAAERKMQSFKRVLAEHERRQRDYEASEARYGKCVNGDQQACADIKAGKPALSEQQLAESGEVSTDTDANRCVTTAEIRLNASFQGNTSASVMNGCGEKVDVRICLKRGSDWNCGVDLAVEPQERAVHSSFNATGEVFVDARPTGSSRRFDDPPG